MMGGTNMCDREIFKYFSFLKNWICDVTMVENAEISGYKELFILIVYCTKSARQTPIKNYHNRKIE